MSSYKAKRTQPLEAQESGSDCSLESTLGAFATRIARKLKERDEQQSESERAADVRHGLILEAMTTIRKALQETLRINLGNRFSLQLSVDDWEGWPRVQLWLKDGLAPEKKDFVLIVTANDRKRVGTVDISLRSGQCLGKINLTDRTKLGGLSLLLKKAVRQFLDIIAAYVLNPVNPEDLIEVQSKPIEGEEVDIIAEGLKGADVFAEDESIDSDNVISSDDPAYKQEAIEQPDLYSEEGETRIPSVMIKEAFST